MRTLQAALCLLFALPVHSQSGRTSQPSISHSEPPTFPFVNLTFLEPRLDSPIQLPSPVMSGSPRCGPDGEAFLQIMGPPPVYTSKIIYSVTPDGKATHYSLDRITGLTDVSIVAFDPGSSMATFLLRARPPGSETPSPSYYLAFYDYDGKFLDYSKVDTEIEPATVAQLSGETFVIGGADMATGLVKFVVVGSNGQRLHDLDAMAIMPSDRKLETMLKSLSIVGMRPEDLSPSMRAYSVLSALQWAHSAEGLLMMMPGAGSQIMKVPRSGELSFVQLSLPKDQIADSLITDKSRLFIRTYTRNTEGDWSLFEVDPETGATLRKLLTSDVPATSIACPTESGFYGFRWIKNKPYLIFGKL